MANPQMQRVRVTRAFYYRRELQGAGSVLDIERSLAFELRNANKLEFVASDEKKSHNQDLPDPNKKAAEQNAALKSATAKAAATAEPKG